MQWMSIVAGIIAGGAAFVMLSRWGKKNRNSTKGEVSQVAVVKMVTVTGEDTPTVEFSVGGRALTFEIRAAIATQLKAGQQGVLTYRNDTFVYFVPREDLYEAKDGGSLPCVS